MNFDQAVSILLDQYHEGAYSNNSNDPGKETMWGITQRVAWANGYTGAMRYLTRDGAIAIYKKAWWEFLRIDELPDLMRYSLFDAAVNSGQSQATKWLQEVVGAQEDGVLGDETIAAAKLVNPLKAAILMEVTRTDMETNLPIWTSFSRGWARRMVANVKQIVGKPI